MRLVVLGDSVPWGQGLADPHKYAAIVSGRIGGPASPPPEYYAHSGAIIDPEGTYGSGASRCANLSSEIPQAAPTLRGQIQLIATPETADLVILNGGLNDVDFRRIVNPSTSPAQLSIWIRNACYAGMKLALAELARRLSQPTSRAIVTGYYPILSSESDQSLIEDLLLICGIGLPAHLRHDPLLERVTRLCLQFWHESDAALAAAVKESAVTTGFRDRLSYVSGPIGESHALFTPTPWLFELRDGPNPEDEVAAARSIACDACYTDPLQLLQREQCHLASVGHPNVTGAAAYADAIVSALTAA
jgi:hypothetical protein